MLLMQSSIGYIMGTYKATLVVYAQYLSTTGLRAIEYISGISQVLML